MSGQAWMKEDRDIQAPNIVRSTSWFNQLSFLVQTEILTWLGNHERVDVFKKFVEICDVRMISCTMTDRSGIDKASEL